MKRVATPPSPDGRGRAAQAVVRCAVLIGHTHGYAENDASVCVRERSRMCEIFARVSVIEAKSHCYNGLR